MNIIWKIKYYLKGYKKKISGLLYDVQTSFTLSRSSHSEILDVFSVISKQVLLFPGFSII